MTLLAVIVFTVVIYCFFCRKKNVDVDDQFTRANSIINNSGIQSIVSLHDSNISTKNGDFDYRAYDKVEKVSPTQFMIRHLTDRMHDICVNMRLDEEKN